MRGIFYLFVAAGLLLLLVVVANATIVNGIFWGIVEGYAGRVVDPHNSGNCRIVNTEEIFKKGTGWLVIGLVFDPIDKTQGLHLWGISEGKVVDLTCYSCKRLKTYVYLRVLNRRIVDVQILNVKGEERKIVENNVSYLKTYIFTRGVIRKLAP